MRGALSLEGGKDPKAFVHIYVCFGWCADWFDGFIVTCLLKMAKFGIKSINQSINPSPSPSPSATKFRTKWPASNVREVMVWSSSSNPVPSYASKTMERTHQSQQYSTVSDLPFLSIARPEAIQPDPTDNTMRIYRYFDRSPFGRRRNKASILRVMNLPAHVPLSGWRKGQHALIIITSLVYSNSRVEREKYRSFRIS